jgi:hypothetical protein
MQREVVVEGPVITISNANLTMTTTYDSLAITGTSGKISLRDYKYYGNSGQSDWSLFEWPSDSVHVDFEQLEITPDHPEITSSKAFLTFKGQLETPVEGIYEFISGARKEDEPPTYPRFKSYLNDAELSSLDERLSIKGGFMLKGNEIFYESILGEVNVVEGYARGVKRFKASGKSFALKDSALLTNLASLIIYHREDSIYHPGLKLDYKLDSGLLIAVNDHPSFKHTPLLSSLFKIEIQAEYLEWDIDTDSLDISRLTAKNQVPVIFESEEYFSQNRFTNLSGIYEFNPLLLVIGYSHKVNSLQFYSSDLARETKQNPRTVKSAMRKLAEEGYINYNSTTDQVRVKRKAVHYYLSSRRRKDYDNVSIPSVSANEPNATFNFDNQSMTIRGINRFYLSEPLDVYITPDNVEIELLANRDFSFDGRINAGNFEYVGKKFRFNYDSFLVVMPQVDSLKFNVTSEFKDRNNNTIRENVSNQLVETGGTLFINHPKNKSALKQFPNYPIYDGSKGATVYFSSSDILDGAYDQSLSFSIPPFSIDSVSADNTNVIGFSGTFTSGGILPPFEEKLQIMSDRSLGFKHAIPPEGFDLFNGRARIYGDITMNRGGLQVDGRMEFGPSVLYSDDFVIYQDSIIAKGSEVTVQEGIFAGVSFPQTYVTDYHLKWYPYTDSLFVYNDADPISMYNTTAELNGYVVISNKGMYGGGELNTKGSTVRSDAYSFTEDQISARHGEFEIKSNNPEKPALYGEDVRLEYDLANGIADMSPEVAGVAAIEYPYAQFKTSISQAEWDLNTQMVTMKKEESVDISNSYFYTTKEDMDSLVFNATAAVYDINNLTLNVTGIPFIVVADAQITPENNEVLIRENADIQEFFDATLVIDTLNGYHNLVHGNIKIHSRNKFEGDATYRLVSISEDTFDIKMGSFRLETEEISKNESIQFTVSSGQIEEIEQVIISPGMIYKGEITMYANKPALELDGFIKLDLKNIPGYDTWIAYSSSAEAEEVAIPFDESVTEAGEPLTAGLHFENTTNSLYATFVTDKRTLDDEDFFRPSGLLVHDVVNEQYVIESPAKKAGESYTGNTFIYNEITSDISFEGNLFMLGSYTENLKLTATGSGRGNLDLSEFNVDALLNLDFELPGIAMDVMGLDIQATVERTLPEKAEPDKTALLYKIAPLVGDRATQDYEQRSFEEYFPLATLSNKLVGDLVITDVELSWSEANLAWYSTSKIGLSHVLRTDINAKLDGFIEIRKDLNGDIVNVFILAAPDTWYYFSFENNSLITFSSNPGYNSVIISKSNAAKAKIGEYVFSDGNLEETQNFINRFRSLYYGIEDLYYLEMRQDEESAEALESFDNQDVEEDYYLEDEVQDSFPVDQESEDEAVLADDDGGKKKKKGKKKKDKKEDFDAFPQPSEEEDDDDKEGF